MARAKRHPSPAGGRVPGLRGAPSADMLRERIKELECLYEVAAAFAAHPRSLDACLDRIVAALPGAMRYSERAEASVTLGRTHRRTVGFDSTRAPLVSEIRGGDVVRGSVAVGYRAGAGAGAEERAAGEFLPEERSLLDAVARQIGVFAKSIEEEEHRSRIEAQLRHADRLATIGQLAAGVAHELNEPLGNILGFAQLAQKAAGTPEQVRQDLDKIVRATLHGREVIRKLLVFARQAPASKVRTNLNSIVDDAMFLLEAGCENPSVRFARELGPALPDIEADPVQMRQIVVNLVVNAIQAIRGAGRITVRTRALGDAVELEVEDSGGGMTPEVAARAFDPFFTTKDVGEGTGLGLSVVQGIITAHGGTIALDTAPGRGSRFTVRVPLNSSAAP